MSIAGAYCKYSELQMRGVGGNERHGIVTIFEEIAGKYPKKLALISRRGILGYGSLNERANQLGYYLRPITNHGCVIAVALKRGVEYVIAMLAIWKIGATYPPLDQSLPAKRMQHMMSDSGTTCLITLSNILEQHPLGREAGTFLCLDEQAFVDRPKNLPSGDISSTAFNEENAYIIYTSGTSGKPKGVAITRGNLSNLVDDIRQSQEIESTDRVLRFSPFCFDASIRDTIGALMPGASSYIPEGAKILPGNLINTIAQHKFTNSVITPSVLRTCMFEHLPDLRTMVLAGEAADEYLVRSWGAGRKLINAYGPTEATVCSTKQVYYDGQVLAKSSAFSVGKPILNTIISILDERCMPVNPGEIGEICVTGPGVSLTGYLNMPKLNAERFGNCPINRCRSYKTGDVGKILSNGEIECLGRLESTRQIELNGQGIELQEIENVIRSASHILDVIVTPQGVAPNRSICAYVVPTGERPLVDSKEFAASLRGFMKDHLPSCSIPSIIKIIDPFPLTTNNKLNMKALANPAFQDCNALPSTSSKVLTPLEKRVAIALLEALGVPWEHTVSSETTYGQLGGGSLQASLVLRHMNKSHGCQIRLGQFYRQEVSIRHLAGLIIGEQQHQASPQKDSPSLRYTLQCADGFQHAWIQARRKCTLDRLYRFSWKSPPG